MSMGIHLFFCAIENSLLLHEKLISERLVAKRRREFQMLDCHQIQHCVHDAQLTHAEQKLCYARNWKRSAKDAC